MALWFEPILFFGLSVFTTLVHCFPVLSGRFGVFFVLASGRLGIFVFLRFSHHFCVFSLFRRFARRFSIFQSFSGFCFYLFQQLLYTQYLLINCYVTCNVSYCMNSIDCSSSTIMHHPLITLPCLIHCCEHLLSCTDMNKTISIK